MYTFVADCGIPLAKNDVFLKSYSSTLDNSLLEFGCRSGLIPHTTLIVVRHRNSSWIPGPADHVCTTASAHTLGKFYDQMTVLEMCNRLLASDRIFICYKS